MSGYRALIVDFGGVLTSPMQDAMVRFADELGIDLQDVVRAALSGYMGDGDDRLVFDFETGRISQEEFAVAFAQRLGDICGKSIDPHGLVQRIFRLEVEPRMFDAVKAAAAAGYKTALLSNSWGTELYPRDLLDPIFDVQVISGDVGLRKPDPAIYELTLSKLDVPGESCVFVDDHPGHLKAAIEFGITTVLHRTPDETIATLDELLGLGQLR